MVGLVPLRDPVREVGQRRRLAGRRGGGHTWPGGDTTTVPVALTGTVTTTLNANHIIWDFFRAHPLPHPES
ncbi:hypothetical protein [Nocardia abscessus]|uniref:hypothetical protein n=1 Tax=Nocardia abscessus TaxID=120957 RepID=UPI002453A769|nr:hypothetical protein [Nocardia abscessus]